MQRTLNFDETEACKARDEAMRRVEEATPNQVAKWAYQEALERLLRRRGPGANLTSEDVRREAGPQPEEHDPRVLGPIMSAALRAEQIEPDGWVRGQLVQAHGRPIRRYRIAEVT